MDLGRLADLAQTIASLATVAGVIIALRLYRHEKRQRQAQRQVEVHMAATEQWRDIVRLSLEDPDIRPLVLRGLRGRATKQHLFYELVALLMAYVCLIESRGEAETAGVSWVAGWKCVFQDFLGDEEFEQFVNCMTPYYDRNLADWIRNLKDDVRPY